MTFSYYCDPRHIHSFPTRRSSDLPRGADERPRAPLRPLRPAGGERARAPDGAADLAPVRGPVPPAGKLPPAFGHARSEEHTSELQSRLHLVCRLLLEKKKKSAHVL